MDNYLLIRKFIDLGNWQAARYLAHNNPAAEDYCDSHGLPRFRKLSPLSGYGNGSGKEDGSGFGGGGGSEAVVGSGSGAGSGNVFGSGMGSGSGAESGYGSGNDVFGSGSGYGFGQRQECKQAPTADTVLRRQVHVWRIPGGSEDS